VTHFRNAAGRLFFVVFWVLMPETLRAQLPPAPADAGAVTVSGSFRSRVESWNWFGDSPSGEYTYPGSLLRAGFAQSRKTIDWQVEAALPFLLGLPGGAMLPGAQGALGLGANYYAANDSRTDVARLFVKQAAVRFKQMGGVAGQSLKLGRFEFIDGTETMPKDATLAALKRDRIAHRLIGNFGFSHVGRSLDGALYALDRGSWNLTALAVRPTRGVFDLDGWGDLDVNVFYGAATRRFGSTSHAGEWRAFGIGYDDYRDDVLKVDNRTAAARRADTSSIRLATVGGHMLQTHRTAAGDVDLLLWGAIQTGTWGALSHRANAFALEAGWQPELRYRPWIRGGWNRGSGDADANDTTHGTFFQLLPTPRVYARLPFFNMMNTSDAFGEVLLRPTKTVAIRGDVHSLRLASADDLWYQGGGAFQPSTFGYAGRPSNGRAALATLADISGDVAVSPHLGVGAYYGHVIGEAVTEAIYGDGAARFAYLELLVRF
jgi:alginate export protein